MGDPLPVFNFEPELISLFGQHPLVESSLPEYGAGSINLGCSVENGDVIRGISNGIDLRKLGLGESQMLISVVRLQCEIVCIRLHGYRGIKQAIKGVVREKLFGNS